MKKSLQIGACCAKILQHVITHTRGRRAGCLWDQRSACFGRCVEESTIKGGISLWQSYHEQLLEAGVHFVPDPPLEPQMATYIYTERNGIYIIDLQKTVKKRKGL